MACLLQIFVRMSSRLGKSNGAVFVEKSDVLEDILDAVNPPRGRRPRTSGTLKSAEYSLSSEIEQQQRFRREELRLKDELQTAAVKKNVQRYLDKVGAQRDEQYAYATQDIHDARSFLDEIDKSLEMIEETKRNKARRQFEDWNKNVHGPITVSIFPYWG